MKSKNMINRRSLLSPLALLSALQGARVWPPLWPTCSRRKTRLVADHGAGARRHARQWHMEMRDGSPRL